MKLKSNLKAPNFKLPSTGKTIFELNKIKKNIILYFYPKDDTPGCTIESKDFSKLNSLISKNKTCVFGIRTTFLINSKGKIHRIWSNVRVKNHAKEVLEEIKKI